jgi:hypothetical protein
MHFRPLHIGWVCWCYYKSYLGLSLDPGYYLVNDFSPYHPLVLDVSDHLAAISLHLWKESSKSLEANLYTVAVLEAGTQSTSSSEPSEPWICSSLINAKTF